MKSRGHVNGPRGNVSNWDIGCGADEDPSVGLFLYAILLFPIDTSVKQIRPPVGDSVVSLDKF